MAKVREPDDELDYMFSCLSRAACAFLLGIPEDEQIDIDQMRKEVREGYCHGSIDRGDILEAVMRL